MNITLATIHCKPGFTPLALLYLKAYLVETMGYQFDDVTIREFPGHGYTHKPEHLEWIDGAPAAVRLLNEAGYYVIVITNQSGVARGYYEEAAVHQFHAHMQEALRAQGAHIDAFYY